MPKYPIMCLLFTLRLAGNGGEYFKREMLQCKHAKKV